MQVGGNNQLIDCQRQVGVAGSDITSEGEVNGKNPGGAVNEWI